MGIHYFNGKLNPSQGLLKNILKVKQLLQAGACHEGKPFPMIFTVLSSSSKRNSGPRYTPPTADLTSVQLSNNGQFVKIIADNTGRSLYFFSNDSATASTCNSNFSLTWPTGYIESTAIGTGLTASDLSLTKRDGSKQTTCTGCPLYYFANDIKAANAQFVGLDSVKYDNQGLPGEGVSQ